MTVIRERIYTLSKVGANTWVDVGPRGTLQRNTALDVAYGRLQERVKKIGHHIVTRPETHIHGDPRKMPAGMRGPWWDRWAFATITVTICPCPGPEHMISKPNPYTIRFDLEQS